MKLRMPFHSNTSSGLIGIFEKSWMRRKNSKFPPRLKYSLSLTVSALLDLGSERLKRNIEPFEPTLEKPVQIQPVSFDWKSDEYPEFNFWFIATLRFDCAGCGKATAWAAARYDRGSGPFFRSLSFAPPIGPSLSLPTSN